ncbi:M48 family metalloprotease, partial [Burkholderia anthina]|uniref:M48 family metalloprotease n=1 Tax=Burkholderia anthina TaxID=179879 RepID=UPI001589A336
FRDTIPLTAHQRAADYTVARTRLTMLQIVAGAVLLIALTLFGGVGAIDHALRGWLGGGYGQQILLIAAVLLITSAVEIPFDYVRQFGIEGRFGFNRMTRKLFFADLARNTAVGAAKRIVFFDTLLARLSGSEIEAVLAHELGHFKRRHIVKRMLVTFVLSL